ncbi:MULTISPECIES: hypothetical protein [Pedobacter]|uniref:Uncharacterized protein n=1 Tax=Pedobacter suwonensis TaxID=332999 RepID=A0A1I0TTH2_9SPHI|nr:MULTISPECIES: hypothetical protein [Pedobacter]SFA55017.1 hypothetical protein SAMN04488511_11467 [Pedobacter suwonensis]
MGTFRLRFEKGRDDWEYGYITLKILQNTNIISGSKQGVVVVTTYEILDKQDELNEQLYNGEATLNYRQTLYFIQATDHISKILVSMGEPLYSNLFSIVNGFTDRFKNLQEFETYYLDYSTGLLALVKREFDKEPELKGALEKLLNDE